MFFILHEAEGGRQRVSKRKRMASSGCVPMRDMKNSTAHPPIGGPGTNPKVVEQHVALFENFRCRANRQLGSVVDCVIPADRCRRRALGRMERAHMNQQKIIINTL